MGTDKNIKLHIVTDIKVNIINDKQHRVITRCCWEDYQDLFVLLSPPLLDRLIWFVPPSPLLAVLQSQQYLLLRNVQVMMKRNQETICRFKLTAKEGWFFSHAVLSLLQWEYHFYKFDISWKRKLRLDNF